MNGQFMIDVYCVSIKGDGMMMCSSRGYTENSAKL